jgi:hypothetical protein
MVSFASPPLKKMYYILREKMGDKKIRFEEPVF